MRLLLLGLLGALGPWAMAKCPTTQSTPKRNTFPKKIDEKNK